MKPFLQVSRSRLLTLQLVSARNFTSTVSTRHSSSQQPTVTVHIDKTPIDLNSSHSLQNFLDTVNSQQSVQYESAQDASQQVSKLFEDNQSIQLNSKCGQKQIIITHPDSSSSTKVQQELALLSANLSKRLADSDVMASLQAQSAVLDGEITPMYDRLVAIEQSANSTTDKYLLGFLSAWTMCTIGIGRLTWWEYSWDIMEPVAWATQAGGFLFWGWYYYITRNENSMTDLNNRIRNKKFKKSLEKNTFDIDKYNELVEKKKSIDYQIVKLRREF